MVIVEFSPQISVEINEAVHTLTAAVENAGVSGVVECTPSYASIGVYYNPLQIEYSEIVRRLGEIVSANQVTTKRTARRVEIPVVYGGDFGPDLESVAGAHHLSPEAVVGLHHDPIYRVCLIGFTPGFPYLGGLPERLETPRLAVPRAAVPAGSVGIGGRQCGIYPVNSPGGWNIIGRTPLQLFDIRHVAPCLLTPGDEVVFRSICKEEFAEIAAQAGVS